MTYVALFHEPHEKMADHSANVAKMARFLAILHIVIGALLICFGIADRLVYDYEYYYGVTTGYYYYGVWIGIWVSSCSVRLIPCLINLIRMNGLFNGVCPRLFKRSFKKRFCRLVQLNLFEFFR